MLAGANPHTRRAGDDARRGPQASEGRGDRVLPRAVRRDARQAERQAHAGAGDRRPARGGRRLRGLRRRPDRPDAGLARHARRARHVVVHARAVAARARALRVRRDGRGRGLAVLPAHDPAQRRRARRQARLQPQDGPRGRVLPRAQGRQRQARRRRPARYERAALLRRQGAVPQLRVPDDALALRERARLRQLRERPRGRERPVRVELHLRRRARHVRPRDLLPLHGPRHGAAARQARHVHAEAVRPPDRQRLPLPHLAVGQGGQEEPLRGQERRARLRALGRRLPLHRRPHPPRRRRLGDRRARPSTRTSASASARPTPARRGRRRTPPGAATTARR